MMNKKALIGITALLLVLAATALLLGRREPARGPLERVVFAVSYDPSSAAIFIARDRGFFRNEGIDASLLMHTTGKAALRSMEQGSAHFATIADTVLMFAGMEERKIRCIASIADSGKHHRVVGLKSRGILREDDLRGKRIGVPLRTTGEFFLYTFLLFRGIPLQSVTLVDLQPEQMLSALEQGRVDAVTVWFPTVTTVLKKLGARATEFEDDNYLMNWNLVAGADLVTARPELIVRVLKALSAAQHFIPRHPDQAITITSRASGSDRDILRRDWEHYHFVLRLNEALLIDLEDQARWALKVYYPDRKAIPDFTRFFYTDGLRAVDPSALGLGAGHGP